MKLFLVSEKPTQRSDSCVKIRTEAARFQRKELREGVFLILVLSDLRLDSRHGSWCGDEKRASATFPVDIIASGMVASCCQRQHINTSTLPPADRQATADAQRKIRVVDLLMRFTEPCADVTVKPAETSSSRVRL